MIDLYYKQNSGKNDLINTSNRFELSINKLFDYGLDNESSDDI